MLQVTQLIGFGAGGGVANASYVTFASSNATAKTSYTFSSTSIGTASGDRVLVVATGGVGAGATGRTVSSLTVGGNAMTKLTEKAGTSGSFRSTAAIHALLYPTGTSDTFVVTFSGTVDSCAIGVWAVTGLDAISAYATLNAENASGAASGTIDCPAGGCIIAVSANRAVTASTQSYTWSGLTERFDQALFTYSGASAAGDNFSATQTGLTVTATPALATYNTVLSAVSMK